MQKRLTSSSYMIWQVDKMTLSTQYAWGSEFEDNDLPFTDVNLVLEEYEFLIDKVFNAIKEEYKDDETCRFYSKLLGKLLILANQ